MSGSEPMSAGRSPAQRNLADHVARRREAAIAGHRGDEHTARRFLDDAEASVRATALGALARARALRNADVAKAARDVDPTVRRRLAEVLAAPTALAGPEVEPAVEPRAESIDTSAVLARLLDDPDPMVLETAAWAAGEWWGPERAGERSAVATNTATVGADIHAQVVGRLSWLAVEHDDALCRESAVAALGAIGDERGLAAILHATTDKATVRRRAVIALAPFEGPAVDEALDRARDDRDWQVRQAAEDLSDGDGDGDARRR